MFIVISDSDFKPNEAAIVNEMFRLGLDLFHIRKYGADEKELREFLVQFTLKERERMVLHHHHELGKTMGIKRFHFSERDRLKWQEWNWIGADTEVSYSTSVHSLDEFNALPAHFDYAFISPVFDSISKQDYKAKKFDLSERTNEVTKLIALGGINSSNAQQAMVWGFDGIALFGAIWRSFEPMNEFKCCMEAISVFPLWRACPNPSGGIKGEGV